MITIYTDGGSRGNPGPAASGFSILDETGKEVAGIGIRLGITTNNIAEYTALIEALKWLNSHREIIDNSSGIHVKMDSQLICSQMQGVYRVKHPNMIPLYEEVQKQIALVGKPVTFQHIPREQNKRADQLVNQALDNISSSSLQ
ncbi:MAG TPA: ribonuclease HI family protein [Patescibacteria group bacterium]|nr:ribonuclease HI family protein [Patescibacteria group bacterium]